MPVSPSASVSIVVCTFNRSDKLAHCLAALSKMDTPSEVAWEIIVVDNNSTDDTRQTIERIAPTCSVPVAYVFEPMQGKGRAINAGFQQATSEIVAMTDDDCVVDRSWLTNLLREFRQDPALDIVGGRVELYDPLDLPTTIRTERERLLFRPDRLFYFIAGCNISLRRRIIATVGKFDPLFGPGGCIGSAEDTDFIYRSYRAGCKVLYAPEVLLFHDHGRRTKRDRDKLERGYVTGRGAFYMKHCIRGDLVVCRMVYWELRRHVSDILRSIPKLTIDRRAARFIWYLVIGAVNYLRHCILRERSA